MLLELQGITKRFGSFVANDAIDLTVQPGEIHALLGENGAGKSTLMNVLYGLYQPDGGQILVDGNPVTFKGPGDAIAAGIGMVHQHFMLIPVFTVAENVALGHEDTGFAGFLDRRRTRREVAEVSQRYGLAVPPDALVADLPVGIQQRVEIVKALMRDAQVLILDEPTAVLTPQETDDLMRVMGELRDSGTSIVFITHKLREVRAIADRITVIRRGKVVGEASPKSSSDELASLMVGRPVKLTIDKGAGPAGRPGARDRRAQGRRRQGPGRRRRRDAAGPVRRDLRARRRPGQRPDRADRGPRRPRDDHRGPDPAGRPGHHRARASTTSSSWASATSPRTGCTTAWSAASRSPRTSSSTCTTTRRSPRASRWTWPPWRPTPTSGSASSTSVRRAPRPPRPRCPAATSRRSSWPASCPGRSSCSSSPSRPAGSTSGRSSSCTSGSWPSGTAARPSSWSPPSSTRCSGLADRIGVMYRGKIIGEVPGGTSAEEIGLLMAGSTTEHAVDPAAGEMAEVPARGRGHQPGARRLPEGRGRRRCSPTRRKEES